MAAAWQKGALCYVLANPLPSRCLLDVSTATKVLMQVVAGKHKDHPLRFAWLEAEQQPSFLAGFGASPTDAPTLLAFSASKQRQVLASPALHASPAGRSHQRRNCLGARVLPWRLHCTCTSMSINQSFELTMHSQLVGAGVHVRSLHICISSPTTESVNMGWQARLRGTFSPEAISDMLNGLLAGRQPTSPLQVRLLWRRGMAASLAPLWPCLEPAVTILFIVHALSCIHHHRKNINLL